MKKLVLIGIVLALTVIILGAYTRLNDAGLPCPDCNGTLFIPQTESLVEAGETRNEIIHRYVAASLGFLIFIIFITALVKKLRNKSGPLKLPFLLLLLVCFQGALGIWSDTSNFLPLVAMGHLLAGFTVLAGLFLLHIRLKAFRIPGGDAQIRRFAKLGIVGIVLLVGQISLGAWSSANDASLVCSELPICEGNWVTKLDIMGAFSVPDATNNELGVHSPEELMTMHVMHRFGAVILFLYLCWLAVALYAKANSGMVKRMIVLLVLALGVQIGLGIGNVVYALPLIVATMHNAVAACLLLIMVLLTYTMYRKY